MYLFKIICSTELVVVRSVLLDMRIQGNAYVRSIFIAVRLCSILTRYKNARYRLLVLTIVFVHLYWLVEYRKV